jgi:hypothetical protein
VVIADVNGTGVAMILMSGWRSRAVCTVLSPHALQGIVVPRLRITTVHLHIKVYVVRMVGYALWCRRLSSEVGQDKARP